MHKAQVEMVVELVEFAADEGLAEGLAAGLAAGQSVVVLAVASDEASAGRMIQVQNLYQFPYDCHIAP